MGDLMKSFGSSVMSFMGELTLTSLKIAKYSSNSVQFRFQALTALQKSLETASRAVTDATAKDIIKTARSGLSDKALPIQRVSADILRVMYKHGMAGISIPEIESLVSLCIKSLEISDQITRRAFADLVAQVLAYTQTEEASLQSDHKKGGKKDQGAGTGEEVDAKPPSEGAGKTIMSLADMLQVLSTPFNKPATPRKTRIGIIDFYSVLFSTLGSSSVENNYASIVRHLMNEIVSYPRVPTTRYERLLFRKLVGILLREVIGVRMLSEQGQIGAITELSNSYLKKWPALMPGQVPPSPLVLVVALNEVSGLLQQLGNAPPPAQEALGTPLIELLSHPNHSTTVAAAWCLRSFCYSTPLRLAKNVLSVMEFLQRDISTLSTPNATVDVHHRALGHAYGLAALFSVIPERPLYVSYDLSAKLLDTAIQLLKKAGDHELAVAGVEIETAWTCIASLMPLGPNFLRSHLSQLLVLWRNALPKPTSKDTTNGATRSAADWTFLLRVREGALSAALAFLTHNTPLVTLDVARRLATLLSNALLFSNAFISQYREELHDGPLPTRTEPSLPTREAMLRRRIFRCFSILGFAGLSESVQLSLLQSAVTLFASPEGFSGSSAQAAIATSAGTFSSLWQVSDGYAYGISSAELNRFPSLGEGEDSNRSKINPLNRDAVEVAIENMISKPIIGSLEHDVLTLCVAGMTSASCIEPPPASTGVVDASIELFSLLLPNQTAEAAARIIHQVIDAIRSPKLDRNSGRKAAVRLNTTFAILCALRRAMRSSMRQAREVFGSPNVSSMILDFLKTAILDPDVAFQLTASEAIGRIVSLGETSLLSHQVSSLVDQVVNNRDPNSRAGCASTFGAIYQYVGGLAAGALLKNTVNVLMSLSNDPHPVVHHRALSALGQVINAANLSYSQYIPSTLGMLLKLYGTDSHEPEGGSLTSANLRGHLPTFQTMCYVIDAVIGVLGPELQESARTRSLTLDLVNEFSQEPDEGIKVEAIICVKHLLIFGEDFMQVPELVAEFRRNLGSSRAPLKLASIDALYALVQKDAFTLSKVGGDRLVEDLFGMLDDDSSIDGVRNVITSWTQQTAVHNPSGWIDLCQRIMSKTNAFQQTIAGQSGPPTSSLHDDEGESLSGGVSKEQPPVGQARGSTSRWRTQLFALQCLHLICRTVASSGRQEHLDLLFAKQQKIPQTSLLVSRISDLIKMAFTASAAYVTEIRLEGLVLLRDIIEIFASVPDPDYADTLLLEQHQAPITAALTPAFSSDSTPEILASAIEVCAVFVGCGVVREVGRMGRILKLLTSALDQCKEAETLSIGDAQELSPNASVMLRVSTLTAWAELQHASITQAYLSDVLEPYRQTLAGLWLACLRDYARIRGDSEILQETVSDSADVVYAGLGREVLLPYYEDSWTRILRAVGIAMKRQDPHILATVDGKATTGSANPDPYSGNAYFFIIFGLVFELLASSSNGSASTPSKQLALHAALDTLPALVRPEYCGIALFEPPIFTEFTSLCYRMMLTEPSIVQLRLIETIVSLVSTHSAKSLWGSQTAPHEFKDDVPLTHCLRIITFAVRNAIASANGLASQAQILERIALIRAGFSALLVVSRAFGSPLQEEVRSISVLLYSHMLKNEHVDIDLVGPTLPALKQLLDISLPDQTEQDGKAYGRLIHALFSSCLQNIDEIGSRRGAVPNLKVKNNMLASVLIVTAVPSGMRLSGGAVEHLCYSISQKIVEAQESTHTALHCAKTLIAAAAMGNQTFQSVVKSLIPGIISYIAVLAGRERLDASETSEADVQDADESFKALASLFGSFPEELRPKALGVFLPVLILLLDPDRRPSNILHAMAVNQILAWATSSPAAFKDATSKLEKGDREILETSVRQAVQGLQGSTSDASTNPVAVKPQISLRSF
ncbi:ARM repeat-containing protein [Cantharellus anzutake]|uniref:ARM repeat-containing protein n=1 Tax=Cantharellus anzutake TaxID=1750568 RepID=UPI0019051553|nr:ARM repeat-containing protein [Cantharellus anzutake]KAF8333580.1 ARM repeat-containing protein [Cantharellus anzutake]